jgi:hypothetical protein
MPVDLSVFSRIKSKADFDREAEDFALRKQLVQGRILGAQNGGADPAAIKIANEIGRARISGDTERLNDIITAGKLFDRGVVTDQFGNAVAIPGFGNAVGRIAGTKKGFEADAKNQSDLQFDPVIAQQSERAKLEERLKLEPAIKQATDRAKSQAAILTELDEKQSTLPQLEQTVEELSKLGKTATHTRVGRGLDFFRREAGLEPRDSAVARVKFITLIDNQVLPLLRQTFGAAFTQKEGESLKATLADPNLAPAEKDAALEIFINQKRAQVETLERQLSGGGQGQGALENNAADVFGNQVPQGNFEETLSQQNLEPLPNQLSGFERQEALFNAKKAIKAGADPEAVKQRLIENGIDPTKGGL